jgi:hypothetical protein
LSALREFVRIRLDQRTGCKPEPPKTGVPRVSPVIAQHKVIFSVIDFDGWTRAMIDITTRLAVILDAH